MRRLQGGLGLRLCLHGGVLRRKGFAHTLSTRVVLIETVATLNGYKPRTDRVSPQFMMMYFSGHIYSLILNDLQQQLMLPGGEPYVLHPLGHVSCVGSDCTAPAQSLKPTG